eukprot:3469209-Pleurochrysis_carterae.AAC.1
MAHPLIHIGSQHSIDVITATALRRLLDWTTWKNTRLNTRPALTISPRAPLDSFLNPSRGSRPMTMAANRWCK